MSKRAEKAIKQDKYVVVGAVGRLKILAYSGASKTAFKQVVNNNMYVNLLCYIDGKPVHKERVLLDDGSW